MHTQEAPLFYRLKKSLWDREAVQQLIKNKCGVYLSERAIGNYLKRWGLRQRIRSNGNMTDAPRKSGNG